MPSADLRARRESVVREHMESTSLAGGVTMLVSHPLTVGRALARRMAGSSLRP
jgi:hypothetical protein